VSKLAESEFKLENPEAVNIVEDWKSEFTDLSECNLDLRIEVGDYDYDLDLEDCIDLHGGLEQMVLFIIVF